MYFPWCLLIGGSSLIPKIRLRKIQNKPHILTSQAQNNSLKSCGTTIWWRLGKYVQSTFLSFKENMMLLTYLVCIMNNNYKHHMLYKMFCECVFSINTQLFKSRSLCFCPSKREWNWEYTLEVLLKSRNIYCCIQHHSLKRRLYKSPNCKRVSIPSEQTHIGQSMKSSVLLVHDMYSDCEEGGRVSMEASISSPWCGKYFKDEEAFELLGFTPKNRDSHLQRCLESWEIGRLCQWFAEVRTK